MSHFVTLLENALKSGNADDPAFREAVYKGALRAFDKMSDQREDRAEFRKLHGPQLAEAITRIEQRFDVAESDDGHPSGAPDDLIQDGAVAPAHTRAPEVSISRTMAADRQGNRENQRRDAFGSPFDGTPEPPTAEFGDFEVEETSTRGPGFFSIFHGPGLWLAAGLILAAGLVFIWMFI